MSQASDIFNQAWKAYLGRDWETLRVIYADDAELILPGVDPIQGADAIVATWKGLHEAFPDDRGEYSHVISGGNIAGGEKRYEGTNTGPLPVPGTDVTLPPTRKRLSLAESDFIVVKDGRVAKHVCYYDRMDYAMQLGLVPTPQVAAAASKSTALP